MGKPTGFMEHDRELPQRRPVEERTGDFREIYQPFPEKKLRAQAARCMDCGVPTCHAGCPLGNRIPDWNDAVYRGRWEDGPPPAPGHQQLSRVYRPPLPRPLRGSLRPGHQ
jgi:glutamate synthase (NADPH/NADH) small chain